MEQEYLSRIEFSEPFEYDDVKGYFQSGIIGIYEYFYCSNHKQAWVRMHNVNRTHRSPIEPENYIRKERYDINNVEDARKAVFEMICELQQEINFAAILPFPKMVKL